MGRSRIGLHGRSILGSLALIRPSVSTVSQGVNLSAPIADLSLPLRVGHTTAALSYSIALALKPMLCDETMV